MRALTLGKSRSDFLGGAEQQNDLLTPRNQRQGHLVPLLADRLGGAVDLYALQGGPLRQGEAVLTAPAAAQGEGEGRFGGALAGAHRQMRVVDGQDPPLDRLGAADAEGHLFSGPGAPFGQPLALTALVVDHRNSTGLDVPDGAGVKPPGFAPGIRICSGQGQLRLFVEDRNPAEAILVRPEVNPGLSVFNPRRLAGDRFPRQ